jgi:hypothetical protein
MGQGLSGSSKLIIAARGYSKEQSQIQADPIFGPYGLHSRSPLLIPSYRGPRMYKVSGRPSEGVSE